MFMRKQNLCFIQTNYISLSDIQWGFFPSTLCEVNHGIPDITHGKSSEFSTSCILKAYETQIKLKPIYINGQLALYEDICYRMCFALHFSVNGVKAETLKHT